MKAEVKQNIMMKYKEYVLDKPTYGNPSLYVIKNNANILYTQYPYLYSGSDFYGRTIDKYSGSSNILKDDIDMELKCFLKN